jgi:uncharacterized cupin superfamily protein
MDITQIASLATLDADLGEWAPKPTAITPGVMERSVTIWETPGIDVGLWECTVGSFTSRRDTFSESCVVLAGHFTIEDASGAVDYLPGDVLVTPMGWVGTWHVHETVRKVYVINADQA